MSGNDWQDEIAEIRRRQALAAEMRRRLCEFAQLAGRAPETARRGFHYRC